MMRQVYILSSIAAAIAGFVCIGLAALSREDDEGWIHSKLQELWANVGEQEKLGVRRSSAVIQVAMQMVSSFLDRVFGDRLFSGRALVIVICGSITSLSAEFLRVHFFGGPPTKDFLFVLLLVALLLLAMIATRGWALGVAAICSVATLWRDGHPDFELVRVLLAGAALSFVYVVTVRKLMKLAVQHRRPYAVGTLLACGALAIAAFAPVINYRTYCFFTKSFGQDDLGFVGFVELSNLLGGFVSISLFLLLGLAMLYRILQRHKLVSMYVVGAILLFCAVPYLGWLLTVDV